MGSRTKENCIFKNDLVLKILPTYDLNYQCYSTKFLIRCLVTKLNSIIILNDTFTNIVTLLVSSDAMEVSKISMNELISKKHWGKIQ